MKWKPSSPMTRSRDQKLRPIIAGAAFLTFVALVYTIYQGGLSQFRVSGDVSNPLAPGLKNDEVVYAAPSNKYAAGNTVGLETHRDVKVVSAKKFDDLIAAATSHTRKRKMTDLTKDPKKNSMQTLINTWTDGSYSPVHRHNDYSEVIRDLQCKPISGSISVTRFLSTAGFRDTQRRASLFHLYRQRRAHVYRPARSHWRCGQGYCRGEGYLARDDRRAGLTGVARLCGGI